MFASNSQLKYIRLILILFKINSTITRLTLSPHNTWVGLSKHTHST